jgi:chromosome partitioning protein
MHSVLVASSKGGCGKSTIATQLAAWAAVQGRRTALVDLDPQGSSLHWCERRAVSDVPAVLGLHGEDGRWSRRVPVDTEWLIVDAPAGSQPSTLRTALERVDSLLVPVLPSAFDLEATAGFLNALAGHPRLADRSLGVGLVLNRLRPNTQASQRTLTQLADWPWPLRAQLRDSQSYVLLTALGKSLFDYDNEAVRQQAECWQPLLHWLGRGHRGAGRAS